MSTHRETSRRTKLNDTEATSEHCQLRLSNKVTQWSLAFMENSRGREDDDITVAGDSGQWAGRHAALHCTALHTVRPAVHMAAIHLSAATCLPLGSVSRGYCAARPPPPTWQSTVTRSTPEGSLSSWTVSAFLVSSKSPRAARGRWSEGARRRWSEGRGGEGVRGRGWEGTRGRGAVLCMPWRMIYYNIGHYHRQFLFLSPSIHPSTVKLWTITRRLLPHYRVTDRVDDAAVKYFIVRHLSNFLAAELINLPHW